MPKFHGQIFSKYFSPFLEWDLFVRESTAYRVLKEKGLCDRGIVPDFYGTIPNIQPALWPNLQEFHQDELPANAVLIEYIRNLHEVDLSNFSPKALLKLGEMLSEINSLGILHGDPFPRNMMIVGGEQAADNRVMWIDFDSAQTLPPDNLSERNKQWFAQETALMQEFVGALVSFLKYPRLGIV